MKSLWRVMWRVAGLLAVALVFFIAILWVREWRPEPSELQNTCYQRADTIRLSDTLKVVSWNIGYAGLGDDMDFFYEGGKRMRTTKARTAENLQAIIAFLRQHADADFILLQEVDLDSRRSYHFNEYDSLRLALPHYFSWFGLNYVSDFVPLPLTNPTGAVRSGVVLFSRHCPQEVNRLQYPVKYPFPARLFKQKHCLLTASFPLSNGGTLYLNNTHNSAYDKNGERRAAEMKFLKNYLGGKPFSLTLGDWNCNPPGHKATRAALEDNHFRPVPLQRADFPPEMSFVYDPTTPSLRYAYEPYRAGQTTTTVVDFALSGPGLEPVSFETIDLKFRNSDHNPVVTRFVVRSFVVE